MSRRNKWDVGGGPGDTATPSVRPSEEEIRQKAREAAARVAASVKGLSPAVSETFTINNETSENRNLLTRRPVLASIEQQTGTSIIVKGRYYPPGVKVDPKLPPLHLVVTPKATNQQDIEGKKHAVAMAVALLRVRIGAQKGSGPALLPVLGQPGLTGIDPALRLQQSGTPAPGVTPHNWAIQAVPPAQITGSMPPPDHLQPASVVLPIPFPSPPGFDLWHQLSGPGGSYLAHVHRETGATMQLQYRHAGTGAPVPEVVLWFPSADARKQQAAIDLTRSLLATVHSAAISASAPVGPWAQRLPIGADLQGTPRLSGPVLAGTTLAFEAPVMPPGPAHSTVRPQVFRQTSAWADMALDGCTPPLTPVEASATTLQAAPAPVAGAAPDVRVPGLDISVPAQPAVPSSTRCGAEDPALGTAQLPGVAGRSGMSGRAATQPDTLRNGSPAPRPPAKRKFKEFREGDQAQKRAATALPSYYAHLAPELINVQEQSGDDEQKQGLVQADTGKIHGPLTRRSVAGLVAYPDDE